MAFRNWAARGPRIRKRSSEGWAWPRPQDMDKDMDRTLGVVGWVGVGGAGWAGPFSFSTLFYLHNHVIQLVTSLKTLWCCSIHLLDYFYSNMLRTICWFAFYLDHVLVAKLIMLHGIVVGLHHTILDHVLLVKLITLHAIEVGLRHTHTIPCDMWCIADKDKDKDWTWGGWGTWGGVVVGELRLGLFFFMFWHRWMCTWACLCKPS